MFKNPCFNNNVSTVFYFYNLAFKVISFRSEIQIDTCDACSLPFAVIIAATCENQIYFVKLSLMQSKDERIAETILLYHFYGTGSGYSARLGSSMVILMIIYLSFVVFIVHLSLFRQNFEYTTKFLEQNFCYFLLEANWCTQKQYRLAFYHYALQTTFDNT